MDFDQLAIDELLRLAVPAPDGSAVRQLAPQERDRVEEIRESARTADRILNHGQVTTVTTGILAAAAEQIAVRLDPHLTPMPAMYGQRDRATDRIEQLFGLGRLQELHRLPWADRRSGWVEELGELLADLVVDGDALNLALVGKLCDNRALFYRASQSGDPAQDIAPQTRPGELPAPTPKEELDQQREVAAKFTSAAVVALTTGREGAAPAAEPAPAHAAALPAAPGRRGPAGAARSGQRAIVSPPMPH